MGIAACLACRIDLAAQQLAPVLGHHRLDFWRAQDGVRLAFVSNLVQTRDGYLWLSSQSGLTRFDGVRFQVFDGANTPALRGASRLYRRLICHLQCMRNLSAVAFTV